MTTTNDSFSAFARLDTQSGPLGIYQLAALRLLNSNLGRLPFSIRVLLSSLPRNCDGFIVTEDGVRRLANWKPKAPAQVEQQFMPSRVILHDFTGVPVLVDIAAMRVAVARLGGGDPKQINPLQVDEMKLPSCAIRSRTIVKNVTNATRTKDSLSRTDSLCATATHLNAVYFPDPYRSGRNTIEGNLSATAVAERGLQDTSAGSCSRNLPHTSVSTEREAPESRLS